MQRGLLFALLSFAAGGLCHFAMAPYNLAIVLFIGIPALYYALIQTQRKRIRFLYSWLFSFAYFVFGLSWISNALLVPGNEAFYWAYPLAIGGLPALLALLPAFFITLIAGRHDLEHLSGWWAFVLALSLSEICRGFLFTGFPWNNFAYTWISVFPIAQIVSFGGLYFLSILTIFWAATPALLFLHRRGPTTFITLFMTIITLLGGFIWGTQREETDPVYGTSDTYVHLIQPNISQAQKWAPDKMQQHLETLVDLSKKATSSHKNHTNIIVWPETATVNSLLFKNEKLVKEILPKDSDSYLLTGLLRASRQGKDRVFYNSLTVFGPDLTIINNYDKHHLVPFGEYIPFQELVPIDPVVNFSGFGAGPGIQNIKVTQNLSISPLICYEIIFPGRTMLVGRRNRPDLIVNVTNDAWYGNSPGPRQHLVQSQFRAIETGVPVIRVANTGISAFITPYGHIATKINYGTQGYKSHPLLLPLQNETYFAQFNHKITLLLIALLCLGMFVFRKEK